MAIYCTRDQEVFEPLRKQYHFRPSRQGTDTLYYAWDVDRLLNLSKHFRHEWVKLDSISEVDENFWFTDKNDIPTCRAIVDHIRLIEQVDIACPVILSSDGRLMDGMHRIAKALLQGRESIKAVRFTEDPAPDYTDVHPHELPC